MLEPRPPRGLSVLVIVAALACALPSLEGQPGGPTGPDRRIVSVSSSGAGTPLGPDDDCLIWDIKTGTASSATEDHSAEIVVLVNGTQVGSTVQTAIQQFSTDCGIAVGCGTGGCGTWDTGIELVEAICRQEGSGGTVECFCGPLFITPLPPFSPQPGDQITVTLLPTPGALPDADTSNDSWTWIFDGPVPGPNRSIQAVEILDDPSGGSLVRVDIHHEAGPTAVAIPFGTEIEVLVNGAPATTVQHPYQLEPDFGSCAGPLACINPDTCALWTSPAASTVGGTCLFSDGQLQCACTLAWQADVPVPPLLPGDVVTVLLRPVPGAVPDLPGLDADDVLVTTVPPPPSSNRRIGTIATRPGSTPGTVIVTVFWEGLVGPSTATQDLTTNVELSVDGSYRNDLDAIALSVGASDCSISGGCAGSTCGSWNDGLSIGEGTCRDTSITPGTTECACGYWFATEFPEEPIDPGDEIEVVLSPAAGALPDSNTSDDVLSHVFDGETVAPNRRIAELSRSDDSAGGTDIHLEIVLERGPSAIPLDLSFRVQVFGDNSPGSAEIDFVEVASGGDALTSCDGPTACGTPPDGCALWTIAQVPVGGTCIFSPSQQNCLCATVLVYDLDAVPIDPDEGITVTLMPVPGALPELPGFPDDEEEEDPTTGESDFLRGDCNADDAFDIGDGIALLGELFSGAAPGPCADACDANDDGAKDIGDPIYVLASLFSGGPLPPDPITACGLDPTPDALDCASFPPCD